MQEGFLRLVDRLHDEGEYRPVGVSVLYRNAIDAAARNYLVVQSAKNPDVWYFPQGGIERGESLEDALSRELGEELGIPSQDITNLHFAYLFETLDAESARIDRRGFTKGKGYVFSIGEYTGDGNFILQSDEIADAQFVDYNGALLLFNQGRPEKAALSTFALDRAIEILED